MSKLEKLKNGSCMDNCLLELDFQNPDATISDIKRRFYLYSGSQATDAELNDAVSNFLGFVKASIKIANDNKKE